MCTIITYPALHKVLNPHIKRYSFLAQDGLEWNTVYTMWKRVRQLANDETNGQTHEPS